MSFTYEGPFLNNFPQLSRSLIANQFCHAVREGCDNAESVLKWVEMDAVKRIKWAREEAPAAVQAMLRYSLKHDRDECERFAEFIIAREGLSWEEKDKLKQERGTEYRDQYMDGQEPTEKQLKYLKGLGCSITPKTKLEASKLIERYKK